MEKRAIILSVAVLSVLFGPSLPASAADAGAAPHLQMAQTRKGAIQDDRVYQQVRPHGGLEPKPYGGTKRQIPPNLPGFQYVPGRERRQLTDPAIEAAQWVPPQQHAETDSLVRVTVRSTNYSGPVSLGVYQSNAPQFGLQDPQLKPLGRPVSFSIRAGQNLTVRARVTDPPGRIACAGVPKFVVAMEINRLRGTHPLDVADPQCISAELEGDSPMANLPADRIALWLRRHRDAIAGEAARRNIPQEAIAGAIAWEALRNVATVAIYQGPGKVHPDPNSAAEQVENMGYVPKPNPFNPSERWVRVKDTAWAVHYIAAIMAAYADLNEQASSAPGDAIRRKPEILATLYQGITVSTAVIPPAHHIVDVKTPSGRTNIRPSNALIYFRHKARNGEPYRPNPEMGAWVKSNLNYLRTALR